MGAVFVRRSDGWVVFGEAFSRKERELGFQ